MTRSSSSTPVQQGTRTAPSVRGAADFLRANEKMSAILPAATRMAALQKDCAAALPAMFNACAVLQFTSDRLLLSTPNAAVAAKLKQQLPKLQDYLIRRGWQVSAIRLKVQAGTNIENSSRPKQLMLPTQALSALGALDSELENSPRNAALKAAIAAMVGRHRDQR